MSGLLKRLVDVEPEERFALGLAFAYFFFLLSGYYILRPIRDEMGVAGGVDNIPWLYTGTLLTTLVVSPIFSTIVAKLPVRRFVPLCYRFFVANLVVFFLVLRAFPQYNIWIGRAFFVWTSVFNLFVVSVFWAFMSDRFRLEQGKRLFGAIGVGGTLGALVGGTITATLVGRIGSTSLLLVSAVLLEVSVQCVLRFPPSFRTLEDKEMGDDQEIIGGSAFAGVSHVLRSPYLLAICLYLLIFTIGNTSLYSYQAQIAGQHFTDRTARTQFYAHMDMIVNGLTIVTQTFFTGRVVKRIGVGATLALVPIVSIAGFAALGANPVLNVLIVFYVLRRSTHFALANPTREVLFTVVPREDKYKAKNFIDTFVYRGGDQIAAWSFRLMTALGLALSTKAYVLVPICVAWLFLGLWLGRRQAAIVAERRLLDAPRGATPLPAAP
ncbi:MAG: hypothetical protein JWO05_2684 [Gemmatimonadetes bacterium]|nr:hypothetical protein [Gemmatimonadota bacterium]